MPRPQLFPVRFCLLAMFAALVCADAALARIAAKDEPVTLQQAWNPKPDALDIELPMPCGLKMAFRAVARQLATSFLITTGSIESYE